MDPFARGVVVLRLDVREARPADEDGPPGLVLEDLRRVEVEAVVELDEVLLVDASVGTVGVHEAVVLGEQVDDRAFHGEVSGVMDVLEREGPLGHALRAHEEELPPADARDVGALPHVSEGRVARVGRRALELPVEAVRAPVEQDRPPVPLDAGAEKHVPGAVLLPDLGVSHVARAVRGVALVAEHEALLAKALSVGADERLVGETAGVVVVMVAGKELVAGVVAPHLAVADHGRPGVRAVLVELAVGHDRGAHPAPGDEVVAHPVRPAVAGVRPEATVLMEEVIGPVELAEPVGIGHVTRGDLQVKVQAPVVLLVKRIAHRHVGGPPRCHGLVRKNGRPLARPPETCRLWRRGDAKGAYSMLMSLSPAATLTPVVDVTLV